MEPEHMPESEARIVGNPPIYFEPQPAWPKGGMARISTAPQGGIAIYSDRMSMHIGPEIEACFSTPSDAVIYMLAQWGEETAMEVYHALDALYGPTFDEVRAMVRAMEAEEAAQPAPGSEAQAQEAEKPLSVRMNEAIELLRGHGWIVSPDLTGTAILERMRNEPGYISVKAVVSRKNEGGPVEDSTIYPVVIEAGGGAGGPARFHDQEAEG